MDKLVFKDLKYRVIGIPLFAAGIALKLVFDFPDPTLVKFLQKLPVAFFNTFLIWEGCRAIIIYFQSKYPNYDQIKKRLLYQCSVLAIYVIGISLIGDIIYHSTIGRFYEISIADLFYSIKIALMPTAFCLLIYESIYFLWRWKLVSLEAEAFKRQTVESQFETLKTQVNPHFLFNSLNTLITIIPENTSLAVAFAERLAKVYRYILQNREKEVVPLEDELQIAEAYLFMQKIRFEQGIRVQWSIPEKYLQEGVAPLSLQILLENAIKHNIASFTKPLHIEIIAESVYLTVRNTLQKKAVLEQESTRLGLENLKSRYKYLTPHPVLIDQNVQYFSVSLPFVDADHRKYIHEKEINLNVIH